MATAATTERAPSPMLSIPDAAWMLDVDEMTIHRLIAEKVIPAGEIRRTGRRSIWKVPRALVTDFLAAVCAGQQVSLADFAATWSSEVAS